MSLWLISVYLQQQLIPHLSGDGPGEDVVLSPNPAYRQVTSIALQEVTVHTP